MYLSWSPIKKTRELLRKERVENKALQINIKKLEEDLFKVERKSDKGVVAQNILDEKDK